MATGVQKRLYVGGLFTGIQEHDLKERFSKFGDVLSVEIKSRKNETGETVKTFAYVHLQSTEEKVKKCFSIYNNTKWRGQQMSIQNAKEDFITRLRKERQLSEHPKEENKKQVSESKLEKNFAAAGVQNFTKKGAVPGTPIPGEKNWIVGKFGQVLPIVHVRRKDKKKLMKYDPSKRTHNLKKLDSHTDSDVNSVSGLTWELGENDSENYKKRKGEFVVEDRKSSHVDMSKSVDISPSEETKPEKEQSSDKKQEKKKTPMKEKSVIHAQKKRKHEKDLRENGENKEAKSGHEKMEEVQKPNLDDIYELTSCSRRTPGVNSALDNPGELEIQDMRKFENSDPSDIPSMMMFADSDSDFFAQEDDLLDRLDYDKSLKAKLEGMSSGKKQSVIKRYDDDDDDQFEIVSSSKLQKQNISSDFHRTRKMHHHVTKGRKLEVDSFETNSDAESVGSADTDEIISSAKKSHFEEAKGFETAAVQSKYSSYASETPKLVKTAKEKRKKSGTEGEMSRRNEKRPESSTKAAVESPNISKSENKRKADSKAQKNTEKRTNNNDESTSIEKQTPDQKRKRKDLHTLTTNDNEDEGSEDDVSNDKSHFKKDSDRKSSPNGEMKRDDDKERIHKKEWNSRPDDDESIKSADTDEIITFAKFENINGKDGQATSSQVPESAKSKTPKAMKSKVKKEKTDERAESAMKNEAQKTTKEVLESDLESTGSAGTDEICLSAKKCARPQCAGKRAVDEEKIESEPESELEKSSVESGNHQTVTIGECNSPVQRGKRKAVEEPAEGETKKVSKSSERSRNDGNLIQAQCESDPNPGAKKKLKKGRDKKQEKHDLSNQKRLESLREKQQSLEKQKSLIKKALASVDSKVTTGQRIVFDSDDDNDDNENDDDYYDKDKSESLGKDKSGGTCVTNQEKVQEKVKKPSRDKTEKMSLFNSDEDSNESDEDDECRFQIKAQFEGSSGQKLLKLQERYKSDERFRLDERFAESDEEGDEGSVDAKHDSNTATEGALEDEMTYNLAEEKAKQMNILQQLVGNKTFLSMPVEKKTNFKDTSKLRFDPTRKDHRKFETTKEEKPKSKQKEAKDKEETQVPEVSTEKHYEVQENLKEVFDEDKGFTFGFLADEQEKEKDTVVESGQGLSFALDPVQETPWQPKVFKYDSSEDEEDDINDDNDNDDDDNKDQGKERHSEPEKLQSERAKSEKTNAQSERPTFFFREDDMRLQEAVQLFCRPENDVELNSNWEKLKPTLQNDYRKQRREAMRKAGKISTKTWGYKF
ncbi:nucleolar protein 8-like [Ptychodera flava]|uniref:nucleolar protein 8-like n=1 Tax=Ptychodera flava TaxID=63121 RepID=UPI00396A667E